MPALLFCLAFAVPAGGAVTISLTPAGQTDSEVLPFRGAVLAIDNDSPDVIKSVMLAPHGGGPAVRYEILVSPRTRQDMTVALPAISTNQAYAVNLQFEGAAGQTGQQLQASVNWPVDWVAAGREAFIDFEACRPWEERRPGWDESALRNSFIFAVIGCLAAGAVLLIRRPGLRLAGLAGVIAGTCAAALYPLASLPNVQTISQFSAADPDAPLVLACRRTTEFTLPQADVYPVYRNQAQMERDTLVIQPGKSIQLHMSAGEVRVFRYMGQSATVNGTD